jgi:hypothetical protein
MGACGLSLAAGSGVRRRPLDEEIEQFNSVLFPFEKWG